MHGSMSHAWRVHRAKMIKQHKPWVAYQTFRHRVKDLHWTLEKAINTPAIIKKRDKDRQRKVKLHIILYRIKKFFKNLFN